jgi:ketosteroid isomerase-like protein
MVLRNGELHGADKKVTVYGYVAWLTFTWVFDAAFKGNNQSIQTKGQETQLWRRRDGQWKLVHVHYSGMPVTGQGQGF